MIPMAHKIRTIVLICGLWITTCLTFAAEKPNRIVSINVCTDHLLFMLVDRTRIASLTHLAGDPHNSMIVEEVQGIHLNRATAEEVIALAPDLVVAGAFNFSPTVTTLRKLGYRVKEIQLASSLQDIKTNLTNLGRAVDEIERAEALITIFNRRLKHLTYRSEKKPLLFARYEANGWTVGQNTLIADVASAAGFETIGERLGFTGRRYLSLEQLLLLQPDLLDLGYDWKESPALASEKFKHPALSELLKNIALVKVPNPAWACGSPYTLGALARLRRARDQLDPLEPRNTL